jgi:hypothetical protein
MRVRGTSGVGVVVTSDLVFSPGTNSISTSQSAVDGETLKKEMVKKPDDFHP